MKKLFFSFLMLITSSVFAQSNLIEFNLSKSIVTYQLNKSTGNLFAIIKDTPGGICLNTMDFKTKNNNIFLYERNDTDRGKNYYQRFELNLNTDQVNIFTSARRVNSVISIEKRDCRTNSCTNISNIPQCSY